MRGSRFLVAAVVVVLAACGGKMPGGKGIPGGDKVPGGDNVPGGLGGSSGSVDPNTCGNYAGMEGGAKLKAFLSAVADLQKQTQETVELVKTSCVTMGKELGMSEGDLGGETKEVCAKVWGAYNDNLKVAVKGKAAFKVVYKPAVCRVTVDAAAEAAAKCEGKATADVGATCTGVCKGKCDGTCAGGAKAGGGGAAGGAECNGSCKGTCHGECEGHADVNASGQCQVSGQVHASAEMKCSDPELKVTLDAKMVVDKGKAEQTLKAMQNGLPKLLLVHARLKPIQAAVEATVSTAKALKDMGPKLVNSFKDQAMCISGQVGAALNAAMSIQADVNVSVSVSAEASGSVGG